MMRKLGTVGVGLAAVLLVMGAAASARAGRQESEKKKNARHEQWERYSQRRSDNHEDAQKSEQELRVLVPKIVSTWESMDTEKIGRYYAADGDFAYFDIAPMKYKNWAEYREGVQKGFFDPNRSLKGKVNDDLQVHAQGKLGWATFTFGLDIVNKQGASSHLDGRWTMVLEKRAGGWIVVHEHVSVPMAGA